MSLNDILGSALSGLNAAQAGLRTVAGNIANVNTPGYSREIVPQTVNVTGGVVTGVGIGEATRVANAFLQTAVFIRSGDVGAAQAASHYLDQLQALLGRSDSASGLPARFDSIHSAAVGLTSTPVTAEDSAAFVGNVQNTIDGLRQVRGDVDILKSNIDAQIGTAVDRVNTLLRQVSALNDTIVAERAAGSRAAGALDQRDAAITELSGLIKIAVRTQADGRVSIDAASGATLLDRKVRQLSYVTSPDGSVQPDYPPIDIRFADTGASTGETISSVAAGGEIGGLIGLRDRVLPRFADQLGVVFGAMAQSLNAASNASTTVPAPASLIGGNTGLVATDRLGFTGKAVFAVTAANGDLLARTTLDFDAMGPGATVTDAINAINAGLGGAGTASFANGRLTIAAAGSGNGVVVAQDAATPSNRAGAGFSQFFGLNDVVRSGAGTLTASGFVGTDPTGFGASETAQLVLRDANGRQLASATLSGGPGQTFDDVVTSLNAGPIGSFGSFSIDAAGRIAFAPIMGSAGATLTIPTDSTNRFGTGRSFTALSGLTGSASGLQTGEVRPDLAAGSARLPIARLDLTAAIGAKALGAADNSGVTAYADAVIAPIEMGAANGFSGVRDRVTSLLAQTGSQAGSAQTELTNANARRDDAVNRRDSFSGVNLDEELSQMVVLQNSYSAAARIMTAANEMYQTLIGMLG